MPPIFTRAVKDPATGAYGPYHVRHDLHVNEAQLAVERAEAGVFNVLEYGAVGDGVADDQPEIASAMAAASALPNGIVLFPAGKTYGTGAPLVVPSNVTLWGYGAKLKALSTHSTDTGDMLSCVNGVSNIGIYGLYVDGSKALFGQVTEQKHGLDIDGATDVTVKDCTFYANKGDGLILNDAYIPTYHNVWIRIENVTCDSNHRQGMSVCDARHLYVSHSRFINTIGTAPQAGMDIEPDLDTCHLYDIIFTDCLFRDNFSDGITIWGDLKPSTTDWGILFEGCTVIGNNVATRVRKAYNVTFQGCSIKGNDAYGVLCTEFWGNVKILGCTIEENGYSGVWASSATGTSFRLKVLDNAIIGNGLTGSNLEDGINLSGTINDVTIGDNAIAGASQQYGIQTTSATVTRLKIHDNDLTGNLTAATSFADDGATRKAAGNTAYNPVGVLGPPSVPATTVAYTNAYGVDATVHITGGTVTVIAVGGTSTGLTSGTFRVPAGQTITITHSSAPSWQWRGD